MLEEETCQLEEMQACYMEVSYKYVPIKMMSWWTQALTSVI